MSIEQLFDQIDIARQHGGVESEMLVLGRFIRSRSKTSRPRAQMPTFNFGPRQSLTELRPRHLCMVEELAIQGDYDRDKTYAWLMENYRRLFGPLRKREVPSDTIRRGLMMSRLLNLIELRREEIAANVLPGGLTSI